jgi:hypothetical protein
MLRRALLVGYVISMVLFPLAAGMLLRSLRTSEHAEITNWNATSRRFTEVNIWLNPSWFQLTLERTIVRPSDDPKASHDPRSPGGWRWTRDSHYGDWREFDIWPVFWGDHFATSAVLDGVDNSSITETRTVEIRPWLFVVVLSVAPLAWLIRARYLRRKMRKGFCVTCGYDLRASTGRCPECGTEIPLGIGAPHSGQRPEEARRS